MSKLQFSVNSSTREDSLQTESLYTIAESSFFTNRTPDQKIFPVTHRSYSSQRGGSSSSVFGPLLYLLYTADHPTPDSFTSTFADDTAVVATDSDPATASQKLQTTLLAIQSWLKNWRIKTNETKSSHVTFTTRRETFSPVHINDVQIPLGNHVKYLGLQLDRRLTWHTHIFGKRKQLGISLTKMYWLLGRKSNPSTNNKLLIYKAILKPIWTYGI
jgi:hypothetical protein